MAPTLEKAQVELPADLAKRYSEATTPEERNAVIQEFAGTLGAETDKTKEQAAFFTDEQFRQYMTTVGETAASNAKAAIAAVAEEAERKYHLNADEAQNMA